MGRGTTVWVPEDLNKILEYIAEIENSDKSNVVRKAVYLYVEQKYGGIETLKERVKQVLLEKINKL